MRYFEFDDYYALIGVNGADAKEQAIKIYEEMVNEIHNELGDVEVTEISRDLALVRFVTSVYDEHDTNKTDEKILEAFNGCKHGDMILLDGCLL